MLGLLTHSCKSTHTRKHALNAYGAHRQCCDLNVNLHIYMLGVAAHPGPRVPSTERVIDTSTSNMWSVKSSVNMPGTASSLAFDKWFGQKHNDDALRRWGFMSLWGVETRRARFCLSKLMTMHTSRMHKSHIRDARPAHTQWRSRAHNHTRVPWDPPQIGTTEMRRICSSVRVALTHARTHALEPDQENGLRSSNETVVFCRRSARHRNAGLILFVVVAVAAAASINSRWRYVTNKLYQLLPRVRRIHQHYMHYVRPLDVMYDICTVKLVLCSAENWDQWKCF